MAYIGRQPSYGAHERQDITGDGSTTTFTLTYTIGSTASVLVSQAAVVQQPGSGYTITNGGTQIVFASAPASGETTFIIFLGVAQDVGSVGSGIITDQNDLGDAAADADTVLIFDNSASSLKEITVPLLISNKVAATKYVTRSMTGDGSTTTLTITTGHNVNSLIVTENGVVQRPTTDYTVSGTTLTFGTAPASGVAVRVKELLISSNIAVACVDAKKFSPLTIPINIKKLMETT